MDLRTNELRGSRARPRRSRKEQAPWPADQRQGLPKAVTIICLVLGLACFLAYLSLERRPEAPETPKSAPEPLVEDEAEIRPPASTNIDTVARSRALALDLDGGGITIVSSVNTHILFDADKDGRLERTTWIAPGDAFLTNDRNRNRVVDGISEFYTSSLPYNEPYLTPLSRLDSNGDQLIDDRDQGFDQVLVWRDLNLDGASSQDELCSLDQAGVTAIALWENGVPSYFFRKDGSQGRLRDIFLTYDELTNCQIDQWAGAGIREHSDPSLLPRLRGVGALPDLDQAMEHDWELKRMVQAMAGVRYGHELYAAMDDFLVQWASMSEHGPRQVAGAVDRRRLAVVETFLGRMPFRAFSAESSRIMNETYDVLKETKFTAISLQTIYANVFDRIRWNPELDRCEVLVPQEELPEYLAAIANDLAPEELPFLAVILRTLAPTTGVSVESLDPLLKDHARSLLRVSPDGSLLGQEPPH